MKKYFLMALFIGIFVLFSNSAMAKKEFGALSAPTNLIASLVDDSVCFSWDPNPVEEAVAKYSVDVDVDVDSDGDGVADMVVEFSFGTSDRTDGLDPSVPDLCVLLDEFVYDLDGDGELDPVSGPAHAKVKALKPGKGNGRQNNLFSIPVDFMLP